MLSFRLRFVIRVVAHVMAVGSFLCATSACSVSSRESLANEKFIPSHPFDAIVNEAASRIGSAAGSAALVALLAVWSEFQSLLQVFSPEELIRGSGLDVDQRGAAAGNELVRAWDIIATAEDCAYGADICREVRWAGHAMVAVISLRLWLIDQMDDENIRRSWRQFTLDARDAFNNGNPLLSVERFGLWWMDESLQIVAGIPESVALSDSREMWRLLNQLHASVRANAAAISAVHSGASSQPGPPDRRLAFNFPEDWLERAVQADVCHRIRSPERPCREVSCDNIGSELDALLLDGSLAQVASRSGFMPCQGEMYRPELLKDLVSLCRGGDLDIMPTPHFGMLDGVRRLRDGHHRVMAVVAFYLLKSRGVCFGHVSDSWCPSLSILSTEEALARALNAGVSDPDGLHAAYMDPEALARCGNFDWEQTLQSLVFR